MIQQERWDADMTIQRVKNLKALAGCEELLARKLDGADRARVFAIRSELEHLSVLIDCAQRRGY